ncbi:MAG: ATP-binding protein [Deltaproteobacteria bacterium]|nr:ATP-binding protein [Deltaproteobacteria bacterium]
MVTSADPRPGYDDPSQHLADWSELFARMVDRMVQLKARAPRASILTEHDRARLIRDNPELADLDKGVDVHGKDIMQRARFARRLGVPLPLEILRERFALAPIDIDILGSLATIERGTAFNPYTVGKNEPLQTDVAFLVALLSNSDAVLPGEVRLRFSADAPLIAHGLVELATGTGWAVDPPLVYKRVRIADRVLDFIEGAQEPPPSVLGAAGRFIGQPMPASDVLLAEPALIDQVARALARPDQLVEIVGPVGVGRKSVVGAAARALGRPMLTVDLTEVPVDARALVAVLKPLIREAHLQDAVLVLENAHEYGDSDGQSWIFQTLCDLMRRVRTPMALVVERSPKWVTRAGRVAMRFTVDFPTAEVQRRLWVRHLPPGLKLGPDTSLDALVKRYSATGSGIKEACEELGRLDVVHQRGGIATEKDIIDVVRTRLAHRLSALASVVRTTLEWSDVILPDEVLAPVFEFLNYAAHRAKIFKDWGFDRKLPYGRGLSALFSGPPGTGKTMICSLLAKELGLELYRIDLSQVVNKYIGETEKNLGRVFDEAARGQVMLLFDEADSLFAKRTEVKSSHDRYANLEVNYLLQRMESHEGVVVMTTNAETAIDPAFRRRIRFRIRFPTPDEAQRLQLWQGMMPSEAQVAPNVDLRAIAQKYPLAGGNIMNALVRAATAAQADGGAIQQHHLQRAAELEYAEMGFLA